MQRLNQVRQNHGVGDAGVGEFPGEKDLAGAVDQGVELQPVLRVPPAVRGKAPTSLVPRDREAGGIDADGEIVFFVRWVSSALKRSK